MKRWQRRLAFGCSCNERLLQLKIGLLSNHQNAAADNPSSGAGRITVDAREKENARAMMHYDYRRLQASVSIPASGICSASNTALTTAFVSRTTRNLFFLKDRL
ncbi:MAG: hypothetical protein ACR2LC_10480 [Pyrinomonadaceae bacterium]